MSYSLRYLPMLPEKPVDLSSDNTYGTPEYDAARQAYCRAHRHYINSLRHYRKLRALQIEESQNGTN